MKPIYRNLFFLFGLVSIGIMLWTFDFDPSVIDLGLALRYLPLVIVVWVPTYFCNALAYKTVVNSDGMKPRIGFFRALQLTLSGFAFSNTTPFGFGGLPYRVMELGGQVGNNRAMASTVLYSMMHVSSHFCLWLTAVVLFLLFHFEKATPFVWALIALFLVVLSVLIYFFYYGYKNGMIVKLYGWAMKLPLLSKPLGRFYEKNKANMQQIDSNIACLHSRPRAFYSALFLEYAARVISSVEFMFIFASIGIQISLVDAILLLALASLVGNILFFLPMQLGAREGGLAIMLSVMGLSPGLSIYSAFYSRVRELFWVIVGVLLVKLLPTKYHKSDSSHEEAV